MPFYLKEKDLLSELVGFKSVLIIPCRFCPAASFAVSTESPYIELFRRGLKTASYEKYIKTLKSNLEKKGAEANVFKSRLLTQFVVCGWTSRKRKKLLERAKQHEVLVVLGCESAVQTVKDSVESTSCKVIQGMKTEGLMTFKPKLRLPCNVLLEKDTVTPTLLGEEAVSTKLGSVA